MPAEAQIRNVYIQMYEAMVAKDRKTLEFLHDDDFVLTHMTGTRQNKQEYIDAIMGGTLNYYSATHEDMTITVMGNKAIMEGHSIVNAAVYGGGKHTWHLSLRMEFIQRNGQWKISSSSASTY